MVKNSLLLLFFVSTLAWILILSDWQPLVIIKNLLEKIQLVRPLFFEPHISYWLPGREGQLASGILLGGSTNFDYQMKNAYIITGLVHLVAASGFNVALIVGLSEAVLRRFFNRRQMIPLLMVCIVMYVLICGLQASIVRAGIMSIAVLFGRWLGRPTQGLWILLLAVALMLLVNFQYLTDIGFQLSVAATFGLAWFSPKNEFQTTLVAEMFVAPLIFHHFGQLSLYAIPANLIVTPLVAPITYLTVLGLLVGPALWLAWPLLKFINVLTLFVSTLPFAKIMVPQISWGWVAVCYLVIIGWRFYFKRHALA